MDKRKIIQIFATLASNANLNGFLKGNVFKGASKKICVPGLNCYSCPGAMGACPIGSMQAVIGTIKYNFSFYVSGMLLLFGVMFGRFICGWLCPFGFFQDLLHKISTPKIKVKDKVNNILKYFKYAILLIFVIILPMFLVNEFGTSPPLLLSIYLPRRNTARRHTFAFYESIFKGRNRRVIHMEIIYINKHYSGFNICV